MSDTDNRGERDRSTGGYDHTREVSASSTASRRRLLGLLGAGSIAGIAGCSQVLGGDGTDGGGDSPETATESPDGGEPTEEQTPTEREEELQESVTVGVRTNIIPASQTLDWYLGYYTRAIEPLVWITHDMQPLPWLAKSWTRTGKHTWEFTLRDGITFHNGDPLRAEHVIGTLGDRLEAYSWARSDFNLRTGGDGLSTVDESTVKMTTAYATADQPAYLSHMSAAILHPDSSPLKDGNTRADAVGTGPYEIESIDPDQRITLGAYEDYWGGRPRTSGPHAKQVEIRTITDNNTRALALKGNKIDVGEELPPSQLGAIEQRGDLKAAIQPDAGTAAARFNLVDAPTSDVKVRKALNYAVSQQAIVDGSQNGLGIPAKGPMPTLMADSAHDSLPAYGPDTARAKKLLEQSTYDGETIQIVGMQGEPPQASLVAQIIARQASAIGVDVEINIVGRAARRERELTGDGHLFMETKMQTTTSPFSTLKHWLSPSVFFRASPNSRPTNDLGKTHPDLEDRLNQAAASAFESVGEERRSHLEDVQSILVDDAAVIVPLFHPEYLVGMHTGVEGVDWHPQARQTRLENLRYYR